MADAKDARGEWLKHLCEEAEARCAAGQYASSIEGYVKALRLLETNGKGAGQIYFDALQPLTHLGRYDEAHEWAERAYEIFQRNSDTLLLARLDVSIGDILFHQNRYKDALLRYQKALSSIGPTDHAAVLGNIAKCSLHLGQSGRALEQYQTLRDWCAQNSLHALKAGADYEIAHLHRLRGEYRKAIDSFRLTRNECEKTSDFYHIALCNSDESEMFLDLNRPTEAGCLAERAALTFESLGLKHEQANAMVNQAAACFQRGDSKQAEKLLHTARKLLARGENWYWRAILDLYQAVICESKHSWEEARIYAERALSVFKHSPLAGKLAFCYALLAWLSIAEGDLPAAQDRLREMEAAAHSPALRFCVSYLRGALREKSGDRQTAWEDYMAALRQLEEPLRAQWLEELKISFLPEKTELYASAVSMSLEWGQVARQDPFSWVQQAKSKSVLERLYGEPAADSPGDSTDRERIGELRRNLTANYRLAEAMEVAFRATTHETLLPLHRQIQEGEQELLRLRQEVEPSSDFLPVRTIQETLPKEAALVEFFCLGDFLHAWVLSQQCVEHVNCGPFDRIKETFHLLQFQLEQSSLAPEYAAKFQPTRLRAVNLHLGELYRTLIEPIRGLLRGSHVIFAPSGFLHHLPFHALLDAEGRSLIDRYKVSYAPSASAFARDALRPPISGKGSLILAVPDASSSGISEEAAAMWAILPAAEAVLDNESSPDTLKRLGAPKRYIHVATRGLLQREHPLSLAMRLVKSGTVLFDLSHLNLHVELLTLSGFTASADELADFARNILEAGARSLIANLWEVNADTTTRFMISFYRHFLSRGATDKAGALRKAILETRETHPHPHHWASFILVRGDGAADTTRLS